MLIYNDISYEKTSIDSKISKICGRLAYQILENNINEDEIL